MVQALKAGEIDFADVPSTLSPRAEGDGRRRHHDTAPSTSTQPRCNFGGSDPHMPLRHSTGDAGTATRPSIVR